MYLETSPDFTEFQGLAWKQPSKPNAPKDCAKVLLRCGLVEWHFSCKSSFLTICHYLWVNNQGQVSAWPSWVTRVPVLDRRDYSLNELQGLANRWQQNWENMSGNRTWGAGPGRTSYETRCWMCGHSRMTQDLISCQQCLEPVLIPFWYISLRKLKCHQCFVNLYAKPGSVP